MEPTQHPFEKGFVGEFENNLIRPVTSRKMLDFILKKSHCYYQNKKEMKRSYYEALGWTYPYDGTALRNA